MNEDTYLKDNIKKCVDYVMSKNDDDKRRIITGMFQYNDYLINEQLLVKALNDKEKQEWFNNDMFDTYKLEIERLNNIINELEKYLIEEIEDYDKAIKSQYTTGIAREQYEGEKVCFEDTLGKLQELKGSDKE